jgi:hypothetical protein
MALGFGVLLRAIEVLRDLGIIRHGDTALSSFMEYTDISECLIQWWSSVLHEDGKCCILQVYMQANSAKLQDP